MFGGPSSKLGRGGAGATKRLSSSFHPPRPSSASSRLSLARGGSSSSSAAAKAPPSIEESYNLVSGNDPLAFSMIIRLAPDLVEEIRRVEAQGGRARMKFDPNPNNPNGNIIDVGGKEFRFTWSREFGDLCDIYEERQSGEDGNGLLVESGSAWRKLNVQRILDESTKNHVKKLSQEAERKSKSRKAMLLEPGNPTLNSQKKALAAVEATPWKNYNKKKEAALKKKKVETLQVSGPPKSTHRPGLPSTTKGRHSSPLPSPPDILAASSSPLGAVNASKSHDDAVSSQIIGKKDMNAISEKGIPTRTNYAMRNTSGGKGNNGSKSTDLQGILVSLLMDKPNGMTLKALEKAVGDTQPTSIKKIEPIIKKIASYQTPGRYILKPDVDLENIKKPRNESGSSPDDNHHQMPAREEFQDSAAPQEGFEEKVPNEDLEEQLQVKSKTEEESYTLEKIDTQHTSPGDKKKGADHSEGQAASSTDSGSGSDSYSDGSDSESDGGSHSGSKSPARSGSKSPAGSGSRSSSDTESDSTSSAKEGMDGSDEDVDIMTSDDEKEAKSNVEASNQRVSLSIPVKSPDGRSLRNEFDEKQDGNESDAVEIEKDLPEEQEADLAGTFSSRSEKFAEVTKPFSPDYQQFQERQNYIGSLFDERETEVKDSYRHGQSDSYDRLSKGKQKRGSDVKNIDEKSERKRLKTGNLNQEPFSPGMDAQMFESSHNLSPFKFTEDTSKGPATQEMNRGARQGNSSVGLQKGPNRAFPGKSSSDLPQTCQRTFDQPSLVNPSIALEKSDKRGESLRHKKNPGKDFHFREVSVQKDKSHMDAQNEDIHAPEKGLSMDCNYKKQDELVNKKEGRQGTQSHSIVSPKDINKVGYKSPAINGRGITLQRELSDLELGELRESDETHDTKQFDREGSFKQLINKAITLEGRNSDITKIRPLLKPTLDSGKPSPAPLSNLESINKKNSDNHFDNSTRSHSRAMQSHSQHMKADHLEVGSQNKLPEMSSKFRTNESEVSQDIDLEGRSDSNRRASSNASKQDTNRGIVAYPVKENKRQTPNLMEDMADGGKDSMLADRNNSDQKKRESSSDENSCSYSKYEKDEPELKGPIRNYSQYKEYVQEYRDKYDSYCSLNKILESYRNEFLKLGKDLEYAKGRDMDRYYEILGHLKESYCRCGTRQKRLKKIFVVLHEELQQLKRMVKDFALLYNKE